MTVGPSARAIAEAEDLRTILDYLGLASSSDDIGRITGLTPPLIAGILAGRRRRATGRRRHIAVVAALVRGLADAREVATGRRVALRSTTRWLHGTAVDTSRGPRSVIEILADDDLAAEALDALAR